MYILLEVDSILKPFESHDKKFYPITCKDLKDRKSNKPMIFNCLNEIPQGTKKVVAELSFYDRKAQVSNLKPYNK